MIREKQHVVVWAVDLIPVFLKHLQGRRYAAKTVRNYRLDMNKIQRELGYPLYLATADNLAEYLERLAKSDLKTATIQRKQTTLRVFFKWAVKHGYVATDPTLDFEHLKKPKRLPIHLEPHQVEAMMGALREDSPIALREAAMIKGLYYTGMRAGELVGLDVESWDRRTGYVRVVGKGDKERLIPVPQALAAVWEKWLAVHPTGTGPMFTTLGRDPGPLSYDRLRGIFGQVMKRAGLCGKGFHPHVLRHTYATRLLRAGVSLDKIRDLLGHVDISTTTVYAHTQIDGDTITALDRIL